MTSRKPALRDPHPRFRWHFLHPRFLPIWGGMLCLRLTLFLPRAWVMKLGAWLGDLMRRRNHKRRRIAEINLRLCFPNLTPRRRQQLLQEHFRYYGRGILDLALGLWAKPARIKKTYTIPRKQWLRTTAQKQPVILVAYHMTSLDLFGSAIATTIPTVAMMKRDRNPLLNWLIWKGRHHLNPGNTIVVMRDQGLLPVVRAMKRGRICILSPDEDFGARKSAVFAPFFGVPTNTLTVVSRLAKLTGALVVPSAINLDARTARYTVTLGTPLRNFPKPNNDAIADATALNRAMQETLRPILAQYMWTFRWFKTRPPGEPNPYA